MDEATLSGALEQAFVCYKDKTALTFRDERFTYEDLDRISACVAQELSEKGLGRGDRIAVRLGRGMGMVFLYLACLRLGVVMLPLNPMYSLEEVAYFLSDSESKLLVAEPGSRSIMDPLLEDLPHLEQILYLDPSGGSWKRPGSGYGVDHSMPVQPQDGAIMLYTSGTTGPPKGCIMTQKSTIVNLRALHQAWGITEADRLMHVLPLNHGHGLYVAFTGCLIAGCSIFMKERFEPQVVLRDMEEHQLTLFMGVPTHYHRLVEIHGHEPFDLSSVRLFISGSAPLPETLFARFREIYGHTILERYGMTEIGIHLSNPLEGERLPGKVGFPLEGTEARVVDMEKRRFLGTGQKGELEVKGPNVFSGYWKKPEETRKGFTQDGWFKTGDLAEVDEHGRFSIVGRVKDLIISGGLNISPFEVEQAINTHPGVVESAVIGVPDKDFGEKVIAYLILRDPDAPPSLEDIQETCKKRLASYKKPKEIHFPKALPRNSMGKVEKSALRQHYTDMARSTT
ncbi:MAG: AMP-binding protein [Deltaproteobacteria bacterium]|nr:AMP-binding protein [Deltaproteobacteria bacterium]